MIHKFLKEEAGYSLVEVIVSIMILAIAILPMVGMFDMGLQTASMGSNYDKARTLANLKLEQAKSLPFETVRDSFPVSGSAFDATTGYYDSGFIAETGPAAADFTNFEYRVEKQYMVQPAAAPTSTSESFTTSTTATDLIRVTVTVRWLDGNTYTTFGLVTR